MFIKKVTIEALGESDEFFSGSEYGGAQCRLTINNRYTHREFKLKLSGLLKDYDLKYAKNSKK